MRTPLVSTRVFVLVVAALALGAAACGDEIGQSCSLSSECSARGDRICDLASPNGYCTVFGCDHDTCPEEAVCVRFFAIGETNRTCVQITEDVSSDDCTPDEFCNISGFCVPRTAETRFCMKKCGGGGDCRDQYECRDEELMKEHGGEPVLPPGEIADGNFQGFCAPAPAELP